MTSAVDYPYIRAWALMLGSGQAYLSEQLLEARATQAPQDAVHQNHDGSWTTFADVTLLSTREQIGTLLKDRYDMEVPEPNPVAMAAAAAREVASLEGLLDQARAKLAHWQAQGAEVRS